MNFTIDRNALLKPLGHVYSVVERRNTIPILSNVLIETNSSKVSVLGSIAAGTPIEAIQHEVDKVSLPEDLQKNGEYIGLKVKGDSMIEAGINDGDTVIVKKTSNVDRGQIAVVLIDDQEATLKRIRKKGNTIALESANKKYDTKIYAAKRIKIQGILVS